jgi:hypothetical protein
MDIPVTTKVTYTKGKLFKTFKEYKLNEAGSFPKYLRISTKDERHYLSVRKDNAWVTALMHYTEHFHFYCVSAPFKGVESIFIVYYKPSLKDIEVRIWEGVNIEIGSRTELNELVNLIIYQF